MRSDLIEAQCQLLIRLGWKHYEGRWSKPGWPDEMNTLTLEQALAMVQGDYQP